MKKERKEKQEDKEKAKVMVASIVQKAMEKKKINVERRE